MSGTKYKGTATHFWWIGAGGTIDVWTESRTFEVSEQAQRIDVTVRGDSAKAYLADVLKKAGVNATRITVHSDKGHDSFLLEPDLYTPHIAWALR
jgi:hypothetical protein